MWPNFLESKAASGNNVWDSYFNCGLVVGVTAWEQHSTFFTRTQCFHTVPLFRLTHVEPLKCKPFDPSKPKQQRKFHIAFFKFSLPCGCRGCLNCVDWPAEQNQQFNMIWFGWSVCDGEIVNFRKNLWLNWIGSFKIEMRGKTWLSFNLQTNSPVSEIEPVQLCIAVRNFVWQCSVTFNSNEKMPSDFLGLVLWSFPRCCVILIQKQYRSLTHKNKNN